MLQRCSCEPLPQNLTVSCSHPASEWTWPRASGNPTCGHIKESYVPKEQTKGGQEATNGRENILEGPLHLRGRIRILAAAGQDSLTKLAMPTPDLPTGGLSVGWNPVIAPEYNNQGSPRARVRSADTKAHRRLIYKGNLGPLALSRTPLPNDIKGGMNRMERLAWQSPIGLGVAQPQKWARWFSPLDWGVFPGQF